MQHEFVEFVPKELREGILYVSMQYKTVVHKCVCGCGNKVVTPITPKDWKLTYDGKTITLYPSIGNWNFPCQSHYYIIENEVRYVRKWSIKEIKSNRRKPKKIKNKKSILKGLKINR